MEEAEARDHLRVTRGLEPGPVSSPPDVLPSTPLRRGRRKVISRGGHYIVWSRGGASPWSSTTYDADSTSSVARHHREYSWHPPGDSLVAGGMQVCRC